MPRAIGVAVALGLAVSLTIPPVSGLTGLQAALADEADTPSRQDVRDARTAARDQARDVAAVQADLAAANQRLQESAIAAAQATEAWNGARYRLEQARRAAGAADERAGIARYHGPRGVLRVHEHIAINFLFARDPAFFVRGFR